MLRRLWKRHVTGRPDRYQAYVSFPTDADGASIDPLLRDGIEDVERVVEGRLDVYARVSSVALVTDRVPADQFDVEAFESILDRIEDAYAGTRSLVCLEKWRVIDGDLVKSYVAVPVKPLFAREEPDRPPQAEPAAD